MKKNYDELIEQNEISFPDNNSGEITEEALHNFHADLLDSAALKTDWVDLTDSISSVTIAAGIGLIVAPTVSSLVIMKTGGIMSLFINIGSFNDTNSTVVITIWIDSEDYNFGLISGVKGVAVSLSGCLYSVAAVSDTITITKISGAGSSVKNALPVCIAYPYSKAKEDTVGKEPGI
ncbi:MAG: hypothetical protein LBK94_08715 [Prevotellaceae bacterium]|jgi:hypothetical protein|nr:hypothetical protein [Prevotellaceae bacterium]